MSEIVADAIRRLNRGEPLTDQQTTLVLPYLEKQLSPRWLFRKVSESTWAVQDPSFPILVSHVGGLSDLQSMWSERFVEASPLQLPGGCGVPVDASKESKLFEEIGVFVSEEAWVGFGADLLSDERYSIKYQKVRDELKDEIEETDDPEEKARLAEIVGIISGPNRLNTGDPIVKACRAARDRKRTAIRVLRDAGAVLVADYFDIAYQVGNRTVTFTPKSPYPKLIV